MTNILGHVYDVQPMAPDADHTTWLDAEASRAAGALRVGVEYRELDPEKLREYYDGDDLAEVEQESPDGGFTDQGVSVHIESVADDHEYLRFDMFDDDPHYHYVNKTEGTNTVIGFDRAANGEMVDWVLAQLPERLDTMLTAAGAPHVADALDADAGTRVAAMLRDQLVAIGVLDEAPR